MHKRNQFNRTNDKINSPKQRKPVQLQNLQVIIEYKN